MTTRTAVITGGAGFLGRHLAARLLDGGWQVLVLDNMSAAAPGALEDLAGHPRFRFTRYDVTCHLHVPRKVDAVAHLAALASPADYLRRPVESLLAGSAGTHNALGLARANRARFLLASTSEVYGDPLVHPQPETYRGNTDPAGPRAVYDEAKRYAEALTCAYRYRYGVGTAIARIFNTYGPGMRRDDGRAVPQLIGQALAGEPLTVHGDGTQTRSFCYADDMTDALVRLLESAESGPVNLGNPEEVTVLELAGLVRSLTGSESPVRHTAGWPDDPRRRQPDITRAQQALGWKPQTALADGLAATIAWYRDGAAA